MFEKRFTVQAGSAQEAADHPSIPLWHEAYDVGHPSIKCSMIRAADNRDGTWTLRAIYEPLPADQPIGCGIPGCYCTFD